MVLVGVQSPGQVYGLWGMVPGEGIWWLGVRYSHRGVTVLGIQSQGRYGSGSTTRRHYPPCGQTPVETLPSRNFVCGR